MYYKIIDCPDAAELARQVNNSLTCGFVVSGGVCIQDMGHRGVRFYQAIVDPQYGTEKQTENSEPTFGTKLCV